MNQFSEYITTACVASLIAGIAEKIAPASMEKYVRLIASLLLILLLVSPIKNLGDSLISVLDNSVYSDSVETESEVSSYHALLTLAEEKVAKRVRKSVSDEFDIAEDHQNVKVDIVIENESTFLLTHIFLELNNSYSDRTTHIQEYLQQSFGCSVTVTCKEIQQ